MKENHRLQSSGLFLLELIFAILFFAVAAAICVQIFVGAHLMSRESSGVHDGINACTLVSELLAGAESIGDAMNLYREQYPDMQILDVAAENGDFYEFFVLFQKDGTTVTEWEEADTRLWVTLTESDGMLKVNSCYEQIKEDTVEEWYRLEACHYVGRRVS